ncbi:MAG: FIST signal transduction protein [Rubrimonas sp.]|uniref:FIST signal transduction protein n=1 Tax=Rubrimonas sp. TaxID=2036015 RepID=UPI002FDD26BB
MRMAQAIAAGDDTGAALRGLDSALAAALGDLGGPPSLAICLFGARHDAAAIRAHLRAALPGTPFIGGTSCGGALIAGRAPTPGDVGLLLFHDPQGDFGVGAAELGDDPAQAAAEALERARDACGCSGELPAAIWVYQPPGLEERVLEGLRRLVGDRCPIVGGSAADDDVSGAWREIASSGPEAGGPAVVLAAFYPSKPVVAVFQSGYAPSAHSGVVTASEGRRIVAIDGRPAAQVYDGWRDGALAHRLPGGGVLAETSLAPLGIAVRDVEGVAQHRLIHPAAFTGDGAIDTFAEVPEGALVTMMEGGVEPLARRAGRALSDAVATLPDPNAFAGALMIYCGGCKMAIGDRIDLLTADVAQAAGGRPVLGAFTFGEQGPLAGVCAHGNLMVSALAFGA